MRPDNMAACYLFTCDKCGFSIESWDEGNPYVEHPKGKRHYCYHPVEFEMMDRVARRILGHVPTPGEREAILETHGGNAPDFVCRGCEAITRLNPDVDPLTCRRCRSSDVVQTWDLAGKKCVRCDGTFSAGECSAIS